MPTMRSLLLVPAADTAAIERAHAAAADVVLLDLAAVPADALDAARVHAVNAIASLSAAGKQVFVRLHDMASGLTADDLSSVVVAGLAGLALPRVREPRDIRQCDILIRQHETLNQVRPGTPVLLAELATARALLRAQEVAQASTRIAALVLDVDAYASDLGVALTDSGRELDFARQTLVNVSVAERQQPLETASGSADIARQLGLRGKYAASAEACAPLNALFTLPD